MAVCAGVAKAVGDDGSQMTLMGGWIVVVGISNGSNQLDWVEGVFLVIKCYKGMDTGRVGVLETSVVGQLAAVEASSGVEEGWKGSIVLELLSARLMSMVGRVWEMVQGIGRAWRPGVSKKQWARVTRRQGALDARLVGGSELAGRVTF